MPRLFRRALAALPVLVVLHAAAAAAAPPLAVPGGAPDPRVTIVAFYDYQCPFCARAETTLARIKAEWPNDVQLLVLHNPLPFHTDAAGAAVAALAAAHQQAFWPFHDLLYAGQREPGLSAAAFLGYAKQLNLDVDRFQKDLADPALAAEVNRHIAAAAALGATGTPTFFVNGFPLRGAQPYEAFADLITPELAAAAAANERGAAWVARRTAEHNRPLHDFLYLGVAPTATAPAQDDPAVAPEADRTVFKATVTAADATWGGAADTAPVTMVVFSDFQCPYCARHAKTVDALTARYGDKLRVVYKHLPLAFHKDAAGAAAAAVCAQAAGQFQAFHDLLFANPLALTRADLLGYAAQLGLDKRRFEPCLRDKATLARLDADATLAESIGARGTPTSFINGRKLPGARPLDDFAKIIDEALALAQRQVAGGTPVAELYPRLMADAKALSHLSDEVKAIPTADAPRQGPATAKVELVVFGDYECPFSARLAPVIAQLLVSYRNRISVVFKQYPLSFHANAAPAAEAALCAASQQKFWAYHGLLFAHPDALGADDLRRYAAQAGLNRTRFEACLASGETKAKVAADLADGAAAGVRGTPTVYVNGRLYTPPSGAFSKEAFAKVIDAELAAAAQAQR